jgi:hypothetical protein
MDFSCHDIAEILFKLALNTINQTKTIILTSGAIHGNVPASDILVVLPIKVVSFIGGGNRSTQRKPPPC